MELLAREQLIGTLDSLGSFFNDWERWAADLTESHVSYPWLLSFCSPYPLRSWVLSLLAVLDAAALYLALLSGRVPSAASQRLRIGFLGLWELAGGYRVELPLIPDPMRRSRSVTRSFRKDWTACRRSGSRWSGLGRGPGGTFAAGG